MVYVTGDFHGDFNRFSSKEMKPLKKSDTLLICGDFGFLWDNSKEEQKIIKKISKLKYNVLFIEGTHDNLDLIDSYPDIAFCGSTAKQIATNIFHLKRGEIYTIEQKNIFVFGGGQTVDMEHQDEGVTWWRAELPSQEDMDRAKENLTKTRGVVDYIVTHECSGKTRDFIHIQENFDTSNHLHLFLDELATECLYKVWYFGHHHLDKTISSKSIALFHKVLPLK